MQASNPLEEDKVSICTVLRQAVSVEISLSNPNDDELKFHVSLQVMISWGDGRVEGVVSHYTLGLIEHGNMKSVSQRYFGNLAPSLRMNRMRIRCRASDFGQVANINFVPAKSKQASCARSDREMVLGSFVCLLV